MAVVKPGGMLCYNLMATSEPSHLCKKIKNKINHCIQNTKFKAVKSDSCGYFTVASMLP